MSNRPTIPLNEVPSFLAKCAAEAAKKDPLAKSRRFRLQTGVIVRSRDRDYVVGLNGALRRLDPKPHKNKAEMKARKRARQAERREAAA